ncbi:MAG: S24 family peptidase [Chlorobi bacterium]|nr:S24 family peptidase [Chlorobiota bacterium]
MFSYSQLDGVRLREVMGKGKVIGFTVEGDSMAGEGIQPGDFIICDYEAEPRRGSSVVVRSDHNEYMCKMWDGKYLQSVRESVLEEIAPDRDWSFVAVVEGVIRSSKKVAREHKRVQRIEEDRARLAEKLKVQSQEMARLHLVVAALQEAGLTEADIHDAIARKRAERKAEEALVVTVRKGVPPVSSGDFLPLAPDAPQEDEE